MIIRNLNELKASGGYQEKVGVWTSARYLMKADGVGFTLTQTTICAGSEFTMEYKNHIEANLVIEGAGEVTDEATGAVHSIKPGSMYTLDKHDRHSIKALSDMRLVCIFTPALEGTETHDKYGSYPLL